MLSDLSIRDVVLIGRLDLSFQSGLCVLTGETGAGKSILLDALGLALGARAEARLVRDGADQASVAAAFQPRADHPVFEFLAALGVDGGDDGLVLRRVVGRDGRSKAFINDQPVSVQLLNQTGAHLVEIHGQFESQRLLSESQHRGLLDAYGDLDGPNGAAQATADAHAEWKVAAGALAEAEAAFAAAGRDEEFLRHALDELTALDPKPGEESELARKRALMQHAEQVIEAMNAATESLSGDGGGLDKLGRALKELERVADKADGLVGETVAALVRARAEAEDADARLTSAAARFNDDPETLEKAEERLFHLRRLARKHDVEVDALAALMDDLTARLAAIDDGGARIADLRRAADSALAAFEKAATQLSRSRKKAAAGLDRAVAQELKPLKLGKATFVTAIEDLPHDAWGAAGCDRVVFQVATNPGSRPGPLGKISSGGELARFTLALKAVLAQADPVPTLVFDEVDAGVGGAVANAVGERLAALAADGQVLVVTHSPQVAARGRHHWLVSKSDVDPGVLTTVDALTDAGRKEEIARMLAGARITDEARAAADSLIEGAGA